MFNRNRSTKPNRSSDLEQNLAFQEFARAVRYYTLRLKLYTRRLERSASRSLRKVEPSVDGQ